MGGTCVNVGCVPKKVMYNTSFVKETLKDASGYGFQAPIASFDWNSLKLKRDSYIKRLNGIYESNLEKDKIDRIQGFAKFISTNKVQVNSTIYEGKKILIAVGSQGILILYLYIYNIYKAWIPSLPGFHEYGVTSDGFFELDTLPSKVAIIGAGYIAIELAGILQTLGTQVTLCIRQSEFLRSFDSVIRSSVMEQYKKMGMTILSSCTLHSLENLNPSGPRNLSLSVSTPEFTAKSLDGFEHVIFAVGRKAHVDSLGLESTGVVLDSNGFIKVNEYQETNVDSIYAVGDVCGAAMLTRIF